MPGRTKKAAKGKARSTRKTTRKATRKVAKKKVGKTAKRVTRKPAKKTARKTARKVTRKPAKKTARKTARKVTRKPAKKTTRKTAKRATRKPAKKTARKTARKVTRKPVKKVARKTTAKAVEQRPIAPPKKPVKSRVMQSKARVKELRTMLETKRAEVLEEIKRAREASMKNDHTSFPEVGDLVSASVEKERAFEHGEAGIHALREISAALEKLKTGTYGICEMCTKAIGIKRLKVMPSARLCIKCKSKEEASGGVSTGR